uniref:Uncharacterized protein n=1 Tax=Arundo donax TaxID=35708 RepID=A0A0A9G9L6_ARUDO
MRIELVLSNTIFLKKKKLYCTSGLIWASLMSRPEIYQISLRKTPDQYV